MVTLTLSERGGSFGCAFAEDVASSPRCVRDRAVRLDAVILGMAYIETAFRSADRQPVIARFIMGTISGKRSGRPSAAPSPTCLDARHFALIGRCL